MIRIRPIERADLNRLHALDQICFRPGIAYSKAEINYFVRHPRSVSYGAVDASGELVGFTIAEWKPEGNIRIGYIVTIDVDPAQRRSGIGRELMQAMLDGLAALQVTAVRLEVAVDNPDAQSFYRNFHFEATGRIPNFYMGTLDAITMQRSLVQL